ncbi:MAG: Fe-S oxidoreductase [Clostridiales bacterium]|nr:Fe-S oxidoreductase [Clostridiales bacterium]
MKEDIFNGVKPFGFGAMRLPKLAGGKDAPIDLEQLKKMVDLFLSLGFTYVDTARPYHGGESEKALKQALVDRYPRNSFLFADKIPLWEAGSYEDLVTIFEGQLKNSGLTYFDYYLIHSMDRSILKQAIKMNAFRLLKEEKAKGRIRHIGFSFHDTAEVLRDCIAAFPEAEFVQLQINYLDWDSLTVESGRCYEVAAEFGLPVVVMEPVKGGALADIPEDAKAVLSAAHKEWSPAEWAIRFAASLPQVKMVLSGMSTLSQMEENTAFMQNPGEPLTTADQEVLTGMMDLIKAANAVACTKCRYCADCPMGINIPAVFELYNQGKYMGMTGDIKWMFNGMVEGGGHPNSCIGCGSCESHCPQHLNIIELLKDAVKAFE